MRACQKYFTFGTPLFFIYRLPPPPHFNQQEKHRQKQRSATTNRRRATFCIFSLLISYILTTFAIATAAPAECTQRWNGGLQRWNGGLPTADTTTTFAKYDKQNVPSVGTAVSRPPTPPRHSPNATSRMSPR